jgi:hypothetical protein
MACDRSVRWPAMQRKVFFLAPVVLALGLAACGGSSKTPAAQPQQPQQQTGTTDHVAKVASNVPSESAKMICSAEAQKDIEESATGAHATKVTKPTWNDHIYSCTFQYPDDASFTMSVKELSNVDETTAYYDSLAEKYGKKQDIQLGQGAFVTKNGFTVVRKDYKVLLVDTSKLPAEFGQPPDKPSDVGINVASVIMSCWTGE